jgi:DNA polymerase-4
MNYRSALNGVAIINATIIAVTFKTYDFLSFSKQNTVNFPINSNEDIYEEVIKILYKAWNFEKIRNIGIRLSGCTADRISQTSLFDEGNKTVNNEKIQSALDKIKDKYGTDIINPASLLENNK